MWLLGDHERTVGQIALAIGASLSSTSQHLRRMELSNVVRSRREHHHIFYRTCNHELLRKCGILIGRPDKNLLHVAPP